MNDPQQRLDTPDTQTDLTGIFDTDSPDGIKLPLSGPQKAFRFTIIISVLVLAGLIFLFLRNPFMKPVNAFYRGLSHGDVNAMTSAFPAWLSDASVPAGTMTTADMCSTVLSASEFDYGKGVKARAGLISKSEVSKDYLERIASGIRTQYHKDVSITKGYWIRLRVIYQQKNIQAEQILYARVYKIDGKWCLLDVPSESQ